MRELFIVLVLAASVAQGAIFFHRYRQEQDAALTRASVKRLAGLTMELFRSEDPPQGKAFWQAIGRAEPMRDVWGQEFRMEIFFGDTHKEFIWSSAGPDGKFASADDIKARVPYQRGATLDLTHPEILPDSGASSTDAK